MAVIRQFFKKSVTSCDIPRLIYCDRPASCTMRGLCGAGLQIGLELPDWRPALWNVFFLRKLWICGKDVDLWQVRMIGLQETPLSGRS